MSNVKIDAIAWLRMSLPLEPAYASDAPEEDHAQIFHGNETSKPSSPFRTLQAPLRRMPRIVPLHAGSVVLRQNCARHRLAVCQISKCDVPCLLGPQLIKVVPHQSQVNPDFLCWTIRRSLHLCENEEIPLDPQLMLRWLRDLSVYWPDAKEQTQLLKAHDASIRLF